MTPRSFFRAAFLLTAAGSLLACIAQPSQRKKTNGDAILGAQDKPPPPPADPDYVDEDLSFDLGSREGKGGLIRQVDAGPRPPDGYPVCTSPVGQGDVRIVEIMIASATGQNDRGEWVEIQNTRPCRQNLRGLTVESPRGAAAPDVLTITEDAFVDPNGTFLVAGSADPALNGNLPEPVFSWDKGDVLKNDGDTITVRSGETVIDTLTYPNFNGRQAGVSVSFPADCPTWDVRADWERWSTSFASFDGTKKGTPNADNTDVACYAER